MEEQENNPHNRKWYLAAKALTGTLSTEEQVEWEALKNDAAFQDEFTHTKIYWEKSGALPYGQIDTGKDWEIVLEEIRRQDNIKRTFRLAPLWKYAAAVTAFVIVSLLVWRISNNGFYIFPQHASVTIIEAPAGSKSVVTLPDSSKVWLNAGSRISFDNAFGKANRNISLEGEAFFDVIKNTIPFNVHTAQYDIAVLGTAFNVKAYRDDDQATTTLVRGSLKVKRESPSGDPGETLLKPNEKFIFRKNEVMANTTSPKTTSSFTVEKKINTEIETAWKDGWLSVQGQSLNDLAKNLERMYDITIHFNDEALRTYRYTGRIRQLSLEQVLKALALTSPIEFTINEKSVTLRENKTTRSKYQSLQTP